MKRLKKSNSLLEIAPVLVKEWHTTANGNLTPRNLGTDYSKKIWWLCSEGHEWQATIKSRMSQNNCPFCTKEVKTKAPDQNLINPALGRDFRKNRRFKTKGLAVIEVPDSGHWIYAELKNFSSQGLCFETDAAMTPGSKVKIKFEKALVSSKLDKSYIPIHNGSYKSYNSTIRWCKRLDDDQSISSFACGVELF